MILLDNSKKVNLIIDITKIYS